MAVEATHMNLFTTREMVTKQNLGFGNLQTEPPVENGNLRKSDSGITTTYYNNNNIHVPMKRPREWLTESTGLLQKNKHSSQPLILDQELLFQFQTQQSEIDRVIVQHVEKVRMELREQRMRQSRTVIATIHSAVAKKLREKDEEIQRVGKINWVLQERAKGLCVENQILREMAQNNEATANSLRNNLEQLLAHVSDDPRCHPSAAAEPSCGSSNSHCQEEDEVKSRNGNQNDGVSGNRMCRLCGVRESIVLLLPCRHLCLCTKCGSTVHHCPVCHSTINASLHVNFS